MIDYAYIKILRTKRQKSCAADTNQRLFFASREGINSPCRPVHMEEARLAWVCCIQR